MHYAFTVLEAALINLLKKRLGRSRLTATEIYADAVGAAEKAIANRFWQTF